LYFQQNEQNMNKGASLSNPPVGAACGPPATQNNPPTNTTTHYDIIVVGAGHAGIEAALAGARLGCRVAVFTVNLDWVGNMPCNPSIGGSSKGQIVRELSALGGEMPRAADACAIQCRMLNLGKGPAVHAPRAQIDRRAYAGYMKTALENQENLDLKQAEIISITPPPTAVGAPPRGSQGIVAEGHVDAEGEISRLPRGGAPAAAGEGV